MLFSSTVFIYLFLPIVLISYYLLFRKSRKLQNIFLFVASLFFYAWGEPKFVLVMTMSIIANWLFGLIISKEKTKQQYEKSKLTLALSIIFNISILFVFKYLDFSIESINNMLGLSIPLKEIALPIGISFFTFQAMSYVIDVYKGKGTVQKNLLDVGLYISFFPQLVAGPIVRYETISDQIENRKETLNDVVDGFSRFVIGLGKKVLLANNFAIIADMSFNMNVSGEPLSVAMYWLGAICYTLQIFFDFSGYSDMAIGLGRMFGFKFLENFNYPYISKSITEFWHRWHISLGTWFRDYVYFPLGGSRVNKNRLVLNLFVVWLLTGIWHGANWTFILWGLMYFILLTIEKLTQFYKTENKKAKPFLWIYTMFFVIIGWVIFRSSSIQEAFIYIGGMFGINANSFISPLFFDCIGQVIIFLILGILFSFPLVPKIKEKIKENTITEIIYIILLVSIFVLSISSIIGSANNPFIYFNF